MTDVHITVTIILCLCCCLLFIIPFFHAIPRIGQHISFTWCIIAVAICMALGCVIDLNHLSNDVKETVIIGAFLLAGFYMACRYVSHIDVDRLLQLIRGLKAKIQKGDLTVSLENRIEDKESHHG